MVLVKSFLTEALYDRSKLVYEYSMKGISGKIKHESRVTSSNPRVTSSNPRVTNPNPRVTSSNLRVTSSNPRVMSSNPRVRTRLNARVEMIRSYDTYVLNGWS